MFDLLSHNRVKRMPDPSIGLGAGAGGGVLAIAWIADKVFGKSSAMATQIAKLYEWHNVADPDDDTQRIWWLSKRIRETIVDTRELIGKLLEAVEAQDKTQRELIEIATQMQAGIKDLKRCWDSGGSRDSR